MKQGLKAFQQLLTVATDPSIREEIKLSMIASYIANDAHQFANEVAAGIEALDMIQEALIKLRKEVK